MSETTYGHRRFLQIGCDNIELDAFAVQNEHEMRTQRTRSGIHKLPRQTTRWERYR